MVIIILTSILLVIITYVYVRWIRLKQYWANRNVPHIPPHPLLGSMTFLQKENPAVWFRRIYDQFKGPYIGIWIFWRIGLVVNSPEIAKNILIKDQAIFRNRLVTAGTTDPVGRFNLLTLDDPLWSVIRKRLTVLFTSSKLKGVQSIIMKKSKQLLERIEKERHKPNPINLRSLMTDFSTDIIGTASFGMVTDAMLTGESHIRRIIAGFSKFNIIRGLSWCSIFFIPELVDFFRFKLFPKESTEYLRKVLRTIITQRGGFEKKVTELRDLPDLMIKIKQEGDKELDMTEDIMLAQAAMFVNAGSETTANILTFAIYELAFRPELQEKLLAELQQVKDEFNNSSFDASILSQMTYLNCVVHEALRMYPTMSWLDRVALADYKVDDKLTIKAGTCVFVNAVGMHYDSNLYPEPNRFNPDRFLQNNELNVISGAYFPFGEGPRKCIGERFAFSMLRAALAAIFLNYEVRTRPNTPKPTDIILEKKGLGFTPGVILSVDFIPRE